MKRVTEIVESGARSELCHRILTDLPNWFGRPDAIKSYVEAVASQIMFAWEVDGMMAGAVSLSQSTSQTFDIHVMGVLPKYHRRGGGSALFAESEKHAMASGARFLTVQTLGPSNPDPFYAQTRAFYAACGMAALAEFNDYRGAGAPMLLMGKALFEPA